MRKWLLFVVSMGFCFLAGAQQSYFLYFQSGQDQPFYIRLGDQVMSAGQSGYIVLPNLVDSTYTIRIGLAGEVTREEKFRVPINGADQGYEVSGSGTSITLTNMHGGPVLLPLQEGRTNTRYESRNDAFTTLLAKASGDPSLLFVAIIEETPKAAVAEPALVKEEVKPQADSPVKDSAAVSSVPPADTVALALVKPVDSAVVTQNTSGEKDSITVSSINISGDTLAAVSTADTVLVRLVDSMAISPAVDSIAIRSGNDSVSLAKTEVVSEMANKVDSTIAAQPLQDTVMITEKPFQRSLVKRYSESSTSEGFGLVFIDEEEGVRDTVRILIPNPKYNLVQKDSSTETSIFLEPKKDSVIAAVQTRTDSVVAEEAIYPAVAPVVAPPRKAPSCKNVASESDFFKLRKNMAAREDADDMVKEGQKAFRSRCYSTQQLRYLSSLFLTDPGKYRFFEAAFGHVADPEAFGSLISELKDEHYINRFNLLQGE